jgi:RNA-binding protein YhbY
MVGQHGLSEAVLAELESTMTKHELLKIKIRAEDREDRQIARFLSHNCTHPASSILSPAIPSI